MPLDAAPPVAFAAAFEPQLGVVLVGSGRDADGSVFVIAPLARGVPNVGVGLRTWFVRPDGAGWVQPDVWVFTHLGPGEDGFAPSIGPMARFGQQLSVAAGPLVGAGYVGAMLSPSLALEVHRQAFVSVRVDAWRTVAFAGASAGQVSTGGQLALVVSHVPRAVWTGDDVGR